MINGANWLEKRVYPWIINEEKSSRLIGHMTNVIRDGNCL